MGYAYSGAALNRGGRFFKFSQIVVRYDQFFVIYVHAVPFSRSRPAARAVGLNLGNESVRRSSLPSIATVNVQSTMLE